MCVETEGDTAQLPALRQLQVVMVMVVVLVMVVVVVVVVSHV